MNKLNNCVYALCMLAAAPTYAAIQADSGQYTDTASLTVNWALNSQEFQRPDGVVIKVPAAKYKINIPFTEYEVEADKLKPYKHYAIDEPSNFNLHIELPPTVLKNDQGQGGLNWNGMQTDFHISFIPKHSKNLGFVKPPEGNAYPAIARVYGPVTLIKNNEPFLSIHQMRINENRVIKDDEAQITYSGTFNKLLMPSLNKSYTKGQFTLLISGLDAEVLDESIKEYKTLHLLPDDAARQQAQLKIVSHYPDLLLKHGAKATYKFYMKSPEGDLSGQYTFDLANFVTRSIEWKNLGPQLMRFVAQNVGEEVSLVLPPLSAIKYEPKLSVSKNEVEAQTEREVRITVP